MLYNTTNRHHQRTSSQQFYNKFAIPQCQSPTSRHVKMLGCSKFLSVGGDFVVQQVVELLWARPLVVFVAGVRSRCPCSGVWALWRRWSSHFVTNDERNLLQGYTPSGQLHVRNCSGIRTNRSSPHRFSLIIAICIWRGKGCCSSRTGWATSLWQVSTTWVRRICSDVAFPSSDAFSTDARSTLVGSCRNGLWTLQTMMLEFHDSTWNIVIIILIIVYIISRYVMLCYIILYYIILYYIILYCIILYYVILSIIVLLYIPV